MKNNNITTILFATILFLATSCQKQDIPKSNDTVELTFQMASSTVAVQPTRATSEPLAEGTLFKVLVFESGADIATDVPIADGNYKVVSAAGQSIPVTEADKIDLHKGDFDFYFVSPTPADYKNISVQGGEDFMAATLSALSVDINTNGQFVVNTQMIRMASKVDVEFVAADDSFVSAIKINTTPLKVSGLGNSGEFTLGNTQIENITGNTAFGNIVPASFTNTNSTTLTSVGGAGVVALSGTFTDVKLEGDIIVNTGLKVIDITLPSITLEAGMKHLITVTVDKLGMIRAITINAEPWIDGGTVGGDGDLALVPTILEYVSGAPTVTLSAETPAEFTIMAKTNNPQWFVVAYEGEKDDMSTPIAITLGRRTGSPNIHSPAVSCTIPVTVSNNTYPGRRISLYLTAPEIPNEVVYVATIDQTNLPIAPAANCYTSYKDGATYKYIVFDTKLKPRAKYAPGNATPINIIGHNASTIAADAELGMDIIYQAGDKLEIAWQTAVDHRTTGGAANMVIKSMSLGSDGVAVIGVNGVGNAVVSYVRSGVILWNYHIWATETNPLAMHYNTGADVNGTAEGGAQARFMDRNLGALDATTSQPTAADAYKYFGVMYQQGRPTPFTGQGVGTTVDKYTSIYNEDGTQIPQGTIGGYVKNPTVLMNITDAIQTPNTYYYEKVNGNWLWFRVDIPLWSDYDANNKSIYDPCPYGYRVPKIGTWAGLIGVTGPAKTINLGSNWGSTWWPLAGLRNASSGSLLSVGSSTVFWSSTYAAVNQSHSVHIYNDGSLNTNGTSARSGGYPVRCVQEGY